MEFTLEMAVVLGVVVATLVLFSKEVLSPDLVALLAVVTLMLVGVATPATALAGFSNPAVHTIAAMFAISAGIIKTGIIEKFGHRLIHLGGESPTRVFFITLVTVVVLSAFVNNTPIIVMMIPVALGIAAHHDMPASKLLIPISYASILGGSCTLIGTSTNLVVSGIATEKGLAPLSMFEMVPVGLVFAVLGVLYLMLVGRRVLPERQTVTSSVSGGKIREYVTELVIRPGSPLIGRRLGETDLTKDDRLRILEVIRGDEILWPPLGLTVLRADDILLVKGSVGEILAAGRRTGVEIIPDLAPESVKIDALSHTLAEAVVTPGSRFEGATIGEIGFRRHFGVSVLALQRHGRHRIREKVGRLRLLLGDILLVQGDAGAIERLREEEGIVLLEGVEENVVQRHRAPLALAILAGVILAATFSPLPVVACALVGAGLMVATRCISPRELYRSLDVRTLVLVAAMIGVGLTAERTGTTAWIAGHLLAVVEPLGPYGALAMVYLVTNVLTEFLSNAAAAVLMVPLAINTAQDMGVSERPFVLAVAFAASAAFSTPVGYQTNTIVYGPGGYRFSDYPKAGLPLNLLFLVVATILIPVFWPF
ncbi:MAG: SLC13 family permease [Planctomycetota bacterium]